MSLEEGVTVKPKVTGVKQGKGRGVAAVGLQRGEAWQQAAAEDLGVEENGES